MNKRDYFAAQAMQAIINKLPLITTEEESESIDAIYKIVTRSAYYYADYMLEARKEWN